MGYTHYWDNGEFTEEQWGVLTDAAKRIIDTSSVPLGDALGKEGSAPEFDSDALYLNGVEADSYETFGLDRLPSGFSFCKTAERPYDVVVVAILAAAAYLTPEVIRVRSDGCRSDWAAGAELASRALGLSIPIPDSIDPDEEAVGR